MRFRRRRCKHHRQRCIHGDEINALGGKRAQCLDCGAVLADLPLICWHTGQPHLSMLGTADA